MPQQLTSFFRRLFNLRAGAEEKSVIIENVKDDSDITSARFWTLVLAIGIASVGLNINSTPMIIGAMLISPLMGPIVSMGLALSIYDWGLMRRSLRNLLTLSAISVIVSALYFAITPITNAQSELLARIQPTIFDVLIAIFGGLAGFIGISRARQSNVIPGVAIATALMPPLCTIGYGIGTLQYQFVLGASYLFLINSIFICLSSLVVASYLKLPKREYPDEDQKKRVKRIITAVIVVIVAPALYTAYTFVGQNNFSQHANEFITKVFEDRGYVVIYKNIDYGQTEKKIELAFLSANFSAEQIQEFQDRLKDFRLAGTQLLIRQNEFSLSEEELKSIIDSERGNNEKVKALEARLENERLSHESPEQLLGEAKAINDKIDNIAIGSLAYGDSTVEATSDQKIAFVYTTVERGPLSTAEAETIENWLKARVGEAGLIVYFRPDQEVEDRTIPVAVDEAVQP